MAATLTWNPHTWNSYSTSGMRIYRAVCSGTNSLLTGNAAAGQKIVDIASTTGFTAGGTVKLADTGSSETCQISVVTSSTRLTMVNNLVNAYTTAASASVTNQIFSARMDNVSNNDVFTDAFVPQDAIYFGLVCADGSKRWNKWRGLTFIASGAGGLNMATTFTGVWEYLNTSGVWTTLTVTDGTTNFTTITGGAVEVDFTPPTDWYIHPLRNNTAADPTTYANHSGFYVRYRILTVTSATEGGKLSDYIKIGKGNIAITGTTPGTDDASMDTIYRWSLTAGAGGTDLDVIDVLDSTPTTGHRAYRIKCHITVGSTGAESLTDSAGYFTDKNIDLIFDNYWSLFGNHTGSISTLGNEQTADAIGSQGCNLRYNIPTTTYRLDHSWLGLVKLYNVNSIVNSANVTITSSVLGSMAIFYSSTSDASEYINCSWQGFGFADLISSTSGIKKHIYFLNCYEPMLGGGGTIDDVYSYTGFYSYGLFTAAADQTVTNLNMSGATYRLFHTFYWRNMCYLVNPNLPVIVDNTTTGIYWAGANTGAIFLQWLVNCNVRDEFGTVLQNALVTMAPDPTAPVTTLENSNNFSVLTDVDGNIAQKTITSNMYTPLAPTLTVAANAGDTSLTVTDTTNFPTSGTESSIGALGSVDVFTHTGKTATTITGIPASGAAAIGASYAIGTRVFAGAVLYSTNSAYTPMMITVSKPGYKTAVLRKIAVTGASYGLKGIKFTIVLPHESVNLAPEIQIT